MQSVCYVFAIEPSQVTLPGCLHAQMRILNKTRPRKRIRIFSRNNKMEHVIILVIWTQLLVVPNAATLHDSTDNCTLQIDTRYGGLFADCREKGLIDVPASLPLNVTSIDLGHNDISVLRNNSLQRMGQLAYLNLDKNKITHIEQNAFQGLHSLEELSLSGNELKLTYKSYPKDVFQPLSNLKHLNINQNTDEETGNYPDEIFQPLINLKTLYIDSFEKPSFGEGFSYLRKLTVLSLDSDPGNCELQIICNDTFLSFKHAPIVQLILWNCDLVKVEIDSFSPLEHLKYLELKSFDLGLKNSMNSLKPFASKNMSLIKFRSRYSPFRFSSGQGKNFALTKETAKYLAQVCVERLDLQRNFIIFMERDALLGTPFCDCVKHIDFSKNNMLYSYLDILFLHLPKFAQLQYLDFSNQFSFSGTFKAKWHETISLTGLSVTINVTLPKTLTILNISRMLYFEKPEDLKQFYFINTDKLLTLDMSYMNIILPPLPLGNLSSLTTLDLSGSDVSKLSKSYFVSFRSLKVLVMRNTGLNVGSQEHLDNLFVNLISLEVIDLSFNSLITFPKIPNQGNIRKVFISNNRFTDLPFDLAKTPNLTYIDLSYNSITTIRKEYQQELEILTKKGVLNFSLDGNVWSCGCQNLEIIMWLHELDPGHKYLCLLDNGTLSNTLFVQKNYLEVWRQCQGKLWLSISISVSVFLCTLGMILYIIMRNPTRFQNLFLRILGFRIQRKLRQNYVHDIYIGYCEEDLGFVFQELRQNLEIKRGLKLFLRDKDVLPGTDIAEGIVEGITSSWRTILVVSPEFLHDLWSYFIMKTTVYAVSDLIPNRIIILIISHVNHAEIPEILFNVVEEEDIFYLQEYIGMEHLLWDNLHHRVANNN